MLGGGGGGTPSGGPPRRPPAPLLPLRRACGLCSAGGGAAAGGGCPLPGPGLPRGWAAPGESSLGFKVLGRGGEGEKKGNEKRKACKGKE